MIQEIIGIEKIDLLNKTLDMKNAGYRLAQACATKAGELVLLYSFIKDEKLTTLRFTIDGSERVESISWLYPYAFLYENEMKDLFGDYVTDLYVDAGVFFTKVQDCNRQDVRRHRGQGSDGDRPAFYPGQFPAHVHYHFQVGEHPCKKRE